MKSIHKNKRIELLAPAGTMESFIDAINAGADAVYVGLVSFSARMRARNFTTKTLAYAVPYAHSRNVKVYVAFNTLVKQSELENAVHLLYQLEQIGVDGVIVQDIGIAAIVRSAFPALQLHASTQMAVHNSAGVLACEKLGMKRVVVARELTLEEITKVCAVKSCEIEIFVHGALCYCFSGMCLASSFFGGASGNRGRCTQVCRRSFDNVDPQAQDNKGYFFSPNDLSGIDLLPQFIAAGVKSLKIEGRMKSANYVSTVVAAYRMAIDDPHKTQAAKEMLRHDLGRRKTQLFLRGVQQTGIIDAVNPAGTGIYIGKIESIDGKKREIRIVSKETLSDKDLVRIQPQSGGEGIVAQVQSCVKSNDTMTVKLDKPVECLANDSLFCIGRANHASKGEAKLDVHPVRFDDQYKNVYSLLRSFRDAEKFDKNRDRRLFVKIDSLDWLDLLADPTIGGVICAFDKADMHEFALDAGLHRQRLGRSAYIEPPPFIAEGELGEWRRIIQTLCKNGQCGLLCQNLSHIMLESGVKRMRADYLLYATNKVSVHAYSTLNLSRFAYSPEDDAMNIKDIYSQKGMVYLFGHAQLFVSRMKPAAQNGSVIADRLGRKIVVREKHGLYYSLASELFCLFNKRDYLEEFGISSFVIDLSFLDPDVELLKTILAAYREKTKYPGSCLFNFKGGLQ